MTTVISVTLSEDTIKILDELKLSERNENRSAVVEKAIIAYNHKVRRAKKKQTRIRNG